MSKHPQVNTQRDSPTTTHLEDTDARDWGQGSGVEEPVDAGDAAEAIAVAPVGATGVDEAGADVAAGEAEVVAEVEVAVVAVEEVPVQVAGDTAVVSTVLVEPALVAETAAEVVEVGEVGVVDTVARVSKGMWTRVRNEVLTRWTAQHRRRSR